MEVRDYCDNVAVELSGWKDKIDDVVRKFDHMSTEDKEKIVPEVNELHIITDELDDRLRGLCNACSTSWEPPSEDHEVLWPEQSASTFATLSLSDIGG